jgi:hypothetical protein
MNPYPRDENDCLKKGILEREDPDFLERERRLWLFVVGEGGFTPPSSFGFLNVV